MPLLPKFSTLTPHTMPLQLNQLLSSHLTKIDTILQKNSVFTWENLLQPLEEAHDELEKFWSPFAHLHSVKNTPEIRSAYEACLPLLTDYNSTLQQNPKLYQALCAIDKNQLTPNQQKIRQDTLLDFELSGVHLPPKKKSRFQAIEQSLSELSTQFENHLIDAALHYELHITDITELTGLPEHFLLSKQQLAQEKNLSGWLLGIDSASYVTVMTSADSRHLRKTLHEAYITRASELGPQAGQFDNGPLIQQILTLKYELAKLLGYANYAVLSLKKKMASSVEEIQFFLEDLLSRAHTQGQIEYDALCHFAQTHCHLDKLEPWDVAYVSEKKKQHEFDINEEALRSYFTERNVWQGIQFILSQLYGLTLRKLAIEDKWDPSVDCFEVIDQTQTVRGYLYTDLYTRPYKRSGAWMDTLQTRWRKPNGEIQLPIATLTCNFTPPAAGEEATYLHDEVITLLHELGHCLHHLLSRVDEYSLSGIHGVEWDAVELPSQLFEQWGWNQTALQQLTKHRETQQPLSTHLIQHLQQTQSFQSGLAILRQLEFSLFDLMIHHQAPQGGTWVHDTLTALRKRTGITPISKDNRFENSFSHIFAGGYAAGYYSYLWAEILSSDVFSQFEIKGIFDSKTGHEFMHTVLEAGSTSPAKTLFETFMKRSASIEPFLRHRGIGPQPPSGS